MLALALGGRTIAEWQSVLSQAEFIQWIEFYKLHPFDDYHRLYRPAAMLASVQGAKTQEMLDWLQPDTSFDGYSEADIATFRALGIKPTIKEK